MRPNAKPGAYAQLTRHEDASSQLKSPPNYPLAPGAPSVATINASIERGVMQCGATIRIDTLARLSFGMLTKYSCCLYHAMERYSAKFSCGAQLARHQNADRSSHLPGAHMVALDASSTAATSYAAGSRSSNHLRPAELRAKVAPIR